MKLLFKVVMICTLVMGAELASAQAAFGLKGGVNLTSLKLDDPDASYDSRTGFHAGIFMRGRVDKVAIQPEVLLFTQRGEGTFSLGKVEESFTYLSIPVILKFYPIGGLNIQAGPQFGFLLDGERKYQNAFGSIKEDIKDSYKSSDVSISLGGGYDFGFGLGLDVRYNIGVKDINDEVNGDPAKSRIFLISLGWNFLQ
ncbi:outer membrane beta-barrel protein [Fulvivirgaceae bacterium PWU4]|uniref:Outer membrane beta-barrel protein n=1 Tax=Chryseosolibacter histidini TaxID=2782349 RepID=A0AAP2DS48_9BACT|nr:porin family protein [Chryseosolibacter histidini]MBT1700202.1 outer membrane beta-barrel protein [Chryseosolibacter histidini]